MGFFEKVKNMFTEEVEEDEVKVEQVKSEVTHVAIESPNASKEENENENEEFLIKSFEKDSKPIFFDDNDFEDLNLIKKEEKPKEKETYLNKVETEKKEEEKKVFKPTPIISPVYGVLDKNYHKEDIVSRRDLESSEDYKESPIDAIRNKAYGTLEDELENTLFGSNSILFKKDEDDKESDIEIKEVDDDILTDLTDDISKELDELLIKKEKYVDEEEKKDNQVEDEDLLGFIDSTLYKDGDE